jgi:hypothetical protein
LASGCNAAAPRAILVPVSLWNRGHDHLLAPRRLAMRQIMEIGLSRWNQTEIPSVALWQSYFPFCQV